MQAIDDLMNELARKQATRMYVATIGRDVLCSSKEFGKIFKQAMIYGQGWYRVTSPVAVWEMSELDDLTGLPFSDELPKKAKCVSVIPYGEFYKLGAIQ